MLPSTLLLAPVAATNTVTSNTSTAAIALGSQGWFYFVATGNAAYVLFGASDVAAATTSNAICIPVNTPVYFYAGLNQNTHFRVIAGGAGTLSWACVGA